MARTVDVLQQDLAGIRTGRATPSLLDKVQVEAWGSAQPVNAVATINVPEPRLLVIQPWDKSLIGAIEKAIQKSELGDRKSTRLNSSHANISYAVFCLKKKKQNTK